MRTDDFEDDGRVIADMSQVERRRNFLPRVPKNSSAKESTYYADDEKKALLSGAVSAALLIGGIFIACGAVLILILQLVWG